MSLDKKTPIWVVTDPTPQSTLPDVCFETTLDGLRLQFAGGLSMDDRPVVFTAEDEAREEARRDAYVRCGNLLRRLAPHALNVDGLFGLAAELERTTRSMIARRISRRARGARVTSSPRQ